MNKLKQLKSEKSDREKVTTWLKSIGAPKDEADEVLENCTKDPEARAYFVMRYQRDCA